VGRGRQIAPHCCYASDNFVTMTEPDNRRGLLSPFEYGVWVFLALAGATAIGVIKLAYVML
jgi:hypothetical protein